MNNVELQFFGYLPRDRKKQFKAYTQTSLAKN
jgi:hypothetical protein